MSVLRLLLAVVCAAGAMIVSGVATGADAPLAEQGVVSLVELQIGDEAIIARIKKAGLSFTPTEEVLKRLADAGASEAVLKALREAGTNTPSSTEKAVSFDDVVKLLELGIDEATILKRLEKSPTVFVLDAGQVVQLEKSGASKELIAALQRERAASPQAAELITDFAIILDCSGSMRESTRDGQTKMAVAQRVVTDLVQTMPEGLEVTFIVYGHEAYGGVNDLRNCQAVKVVRPLSPLDPSGKAELGRLIAGLRPVGATPIALSLKTAGAELAKHNTFCGLVLITDGKETCQGDPVGEAAQLAKNLKITFGANVIGFDVGRDREGLEQIAAAGKGKYYSADSAKELADALGSLAQDLDKVVAPPQTSRSNRRAIKVLKPAIDFPAFKEIQVMSRGLGTTSIDARGEYGEEIRIPSGTTKYDILWVPAVGEPVAMLKDVSFPDRKVVEIRPEKHLGFVKVGGVGRPQKEITVYQRGLGTTIILQRAQAFGDVMVVPVGKVNVQVDNEDIELDLEIEPGTLHELE